MDKLRLELDRLKVESFAPDAKAGGKGKVLGYDGSTCSQGFTCGMMSRGEETFQQQPLTYYACCV